MVSAFVWATKPYKSTTALGINPLLKQESARGKGTRQLLEAVQAVAGPEAWKVRARQPQPRSNLLLGEGKSCRRREGKAMVEEWSQADIRWQQNPRPQHSHPGLS